MTYSTKAKLATLCPDCGQLVAVVRDWNHRNGLNEMRERYRRSRHKTVIGLRHRSNTVPFCLGSRGVVDQAVIFPTKESATA